MHAADVYW